MAQEKPNNRRPRRMVLWLAPAALAIGAVAGASAYRSFANPERVRAEAEAHLQKLTNGRVSVGSATFSFFGGIHLFDVAVAAAPHDGLAQEPWVPSVGENVFSCREAWLSHDPLSALWGRLRIRSIVAVEPSCTIVHDSVNGRTNTDGLFQDVVRIRQGDEELPTIELRNALFRVQNHDTEGLRTVDEITLTLRARPSQHNLGLYDVVWQDDADAEASGHSQIDLVSGSLRNVRGGLPSLSVETVLLAAASRNGQATMWSNLLGVNGRVRARDFNLVGQGHDLKHSAVIDLHNASLSVPIDNDERVLPVHERYLRFEKINGGIFVDGETIRVEFDARLHGSECKVTATTHGGLGGLGALMDTDFDARLSISSLDLPRSDADSPAEQARFIQRFPQLAKFYRDYDPHGLVDLEISARKHTGTDSPIEVQQILVTARGGDASSRKFPYRGFKLTGSVEYRPDGVWIRQLCGIHDGGTTCVEGKMDRPHPCAASVLSVRGQNIPIDDQLYNALGSNYQRIREQLQPEGRIDVELLLQRPACTGNEPVSWRSESTVRFDNLTARYEKFPYPFEHLEGEFSVEEKRLRFARVEGAAGTARVRISGEVLLAPTDSNDVDITIVATGAEFDTRLLDSLPEEIRSRISALHPSGHFDLQTKLTVDPQTRRIVQRSTVALRGVSVQPDGFPVQWTDLEGNLQIEDSKIVLGDVSGRLRGSNVTASGMITWGDKGKHWELAVHSPNLRLDRELLSAAPSKLRGTLTDWHIDGPIKTEIRLQSDANTDNGMTYIATAELDGSTIRHPDFPSPFKDVRGKLSASATELRGTGFSGRYEGARVRFDFQVDKTTDREQGTIKGNALGLPAHAVRGLLPAPLSDGWDRAKPGGTIDVRFEELSYERSAASTNLVWRGEGQIDFHQVEAAGFGELEGLNGALTVSGVLADRLGGTTVGGRLQLPGARLYGQALSDVNGTWSLVRSTDGAGRFSLTQGRAAIHDGTLTGETHVLLRPTQSEYDLTATLNGMQIAPWLKALRSRRPASYATTRKEAGTEVRGVADAYLYLSGAIGDPLSRRGGGQLEVRDGYIYRLPILLAILNVLDMTVPNDEALHQLEADFFVLGNRLDFDSIALRGGSLTLVGSGSMSLPDQAVDLQLVNVGAQRWARVPILTDLVENATKGLVELRVTGPISQPTVRAQPLRAISDELKRLFQKKPPKTAGAAPR